MMVHGVELLRKVQKNSSCKTTSNSLWGKWCWNWKSLLKIRYSIHFWPHISKVAIAIAAETLKFSGMTPQQHRVCLGNLDLGFKIRISDLQSNAKSENGFQRWDICFWIPLSPFDWEIRERIWKNFLKNRGLAQARVISEKRPLFTKVVLQILFRISQSNGKKKVHEFRFWITALKSTLRTDFSEVKYFFWFCVRLQNPKAGFQNRNREFPIKRKLSRNVIRQVLFLAFLRAILF